MAQVDISSRAVVASALNITAISSDTTTVGNIIDMQDQQSLEFVLFSGTITTGVFTPKIEEGDNSSLTDAAVVSSDYLIGTLADATFTVAAADDNACKKIGYVGKKRYVRLSVVTTSTGVGTIGAVAIKQNPGVASIDALS
jgi:hypothetical protein